MDDLYHPRILELAADIPHVGRLDAPDGASTKVSRVCGSVVTVELKLKDGVVSQIAVHPKACALGQAATGVLAMNAIGATPREIRDAREALRAMLKAGASPPAGRFWELRHLQGVRDFPARHASTMLAFDAAVEALDQAQKKRREMTASVKLKDANAKALRKAALGYPETVEDFPWGHSAFKIAGKKVFLFMGEDEGGGWSCSMKLPFRNDEALAVKGAARTEYGLGRSGWVTFRFAAKAKPPMAKLADYLDESWRAVAPKKLSAAFAPPMGAKRRKAT